MTDAQFERKQLQNLLRRNRVTQDILKQSHDEIAQTISRYNIRKPESFRWTNNKPLEARINKVISATNVKVKENIALGMTENWNLANQKYDDMASQYFRNHRLSSGAALNYFSGNYSALNSFINRSVDGVNLSKRVWNIGQVTKEELHTFLGNGISAGTPANEIARQVQSYLKDPGKQFRRVRDKEGNLKPSKAMKQYKPGRGVYRSSFKNAQRLTRTEINMAYRTSDFHRRQRMDFVTGISVHLSGAHPLIDICDEMQGDYPKNFKFVGWHPNCFCYTSSIKLNEKDFIDYLNTGAIPGEKVVQRLPERAVGYVKRMQPRLKNYKSKPYWLQDNFKGFEPKKDIGEFKFFRKGARLVGGNTPPVVATRARALLMDDDMIEELGYEGIKVYGATAENMEIYNNSFFKYFDPAEMKADVTKVFGKGNFWIEMKGKELEVNWFNEKGTFSRIFDCGGKQAVVDHMTFGVSIEGKGLAKKAFQAMIKQYEKMGIQEIHLQAGLEVGGYAWAKYGFRSYKGSWKKISDHIKKELPRFPTEKARYIQEVLRSVEFEIERLGYVPVDILANLTYKGKNIGFELLGGSMWDGYMDMTDPRQLSVLKKYIGL